MKTYLVTGGSGFIGSNYIKYMLKKYGKEINIVNLDNLTYAGNPENLKEIESFENYTFIKDNICNTEVLNTIFKKYNFDYVIHFAAESHVDRSIENPGIFLETNIFGTFSLLNVAKNNWDNNGSFNNKKFVQISTDEVYGSLGKTGYFTEKTSLDPRSPYSASKASADMLVKSYGDTYNFPINITRCSNNYGPFQFPEKLIPLMINNALKNIKLPVYGDGKNIRDWLFVDDHVKAIDIVTLKGAVGEIYNIGGNNEKQNIEIIDIIINTLYSELAENDKRRSYINNDLITYVADRKGHDRRYAIDSEKITSELGWIPETTFEEGIKKTILWYMNNTLWIENILNGNYQK